jgi:predicted nicotinamide N-methyase
MSQDWVRWNGHLDTQVEVEVFGHTLKLQQAPDSHDLGQTVWDASIVLAHFLARNARKGEFARHKVKGKHALELGSGMGLGGLALAMLGCNVVLTDLPSVLPRLQRNYEMNLSKSALTASRSALVGNVGHIEVKALDWSQPEQREAFADTKWDYILAADCIYHEHIIEGLLQTCLRLCTPKTTVLIVNELRSDSVQSVFMQIFGEHYSIKRIAASKLHPLYQHPAIQVFQLKLRRQGSAKGGDAAEATPCPAQPP